MYRTKAKKVFWEFDSIIMQNLSDNLPLFCTPTWPCHHVNENQELDRVEYNCHNSGSNRARNFKIGRARSARPI